MKKELFDYFASFMEKYDFPFDAKEDLLNTFNTIWGKEFSDLLGVYEQNKNCDFSLLIEKTTCLAENVGVHKYTAHLLLFICLSKKLGDYYKEQNISEDILFNSLNDLYYKLLECRTIYGISGTYVASWYAGFFNMTRFSLGRLQFEIIKTDTEVTLGGKTFPVGSKAINMHIPRTKTKLLHKEVLESYHIAAEFFGGEPILFTCGSWLLDPWLKTVLPEGANLLAFGNDFKIIKTIPSSADYIARVVFGVQYNGDPTTLSRDTTLRRAYAESFEKGKQPHVATGFFLYQNGEIIK